MYWLLVTEAGSANRPPVSGPEGLSGGMEIASAGLWWRTAQPVLPHCL